MEVKDGIFGQQQSKYGILHSGFIHCLGSKYGISRVIPHTNIVYCSVRDLELEKTKDKPGELVIPRCIYFRLCSRMI